MIVFAIAVIVGGFALCPLVSLGLLAAVGAKQELHWLKLLLSIPLASFLACGI